jgi:hypothetical protein
MLSSMVELISREVSRRGGVTTEAGSVVLDAARRLAVKTSED